MANRISRPTSERIARGSASPETGKILIVDDEPGILSLLHSQLSRQYECKSAASALEALEYLKEETYDLVLSDIVMPGMSGLELLQEISILSRETVVVLISGNLTIHSAIEALRRGAFDYITKPFDQEDVEASVRRALGHRALLKWNRLYRHHLEEMVSARTNELSEANVNLNATFERLHVNYRATLLALAAALEARDAETRGHSERVVAYCTRLGKHLGLTGRELITLEQGALLHDIGKIGVRDAILLKRGSLTDEELKHMRRHVEFGTRILSGIEFLRDASQILAQHHERYDGGGYPNGIFGHSICLGARIFAVADAVDAITSDRPYRQAGSFDQAAEELTRGSGSHFDPVIVQAFIEIPLDTWRETRTVATEPGRAAQDTNICRETQRLLLR